VTDLLSLGKFNLPTPATAFSLRLWSNDSYAVYIATLRFAIFFLHSLQKVQTYKYHQKLALQVMQTLT